MGQDKLMRTWLVVSAMLWPVVVTAVGLGIHAHREEAAGSAPPPAENSPSGAVRALWAAEDVVIKRQWRLMGADSVSASLAKDARMRFAEQVSPVADRQIDSEESLGADRCRIKATVVLPHYGQSDAERRALARTYVAAKDAGLWKIAEIWGQCTSCDGKGQRKCYMCDGSGRDVDGTTCSECSGSGQLKCSSCKGQGWEDLVRSGSPGLY